MPVLDDSGMEIAKRIDERAQFVFETLRRPEIVSHVSGERFDALVILETVEIVESHGQEGLAFRDHFVGNEIILDNGCAVVFGIS